MRVLGDLKSILKKKLHWNYLKIKFKNLKKIVFLFGWLGYSIRAKINFKC